MNLNTFNFGFMNIYSCIILICYINIYFLSIFGDLVWWFNISNVFQFFFVFYFLLLLSKHYIKIGWICCKSPLNTTYIWNKIYNEMIERVEYIYLREIWKKFNKVVGNINFVFGNIIVILYSKLYSINSFERDFRI